MNTPAEKQQVSEAPQEKLGDASVEDQLSEEFDRLAAESVGETEDENIEETETSEDESAEEVEAVSEESEEIAEVEEQEEEQAAAEESGYTDPAPERWPDELKTAYNELPPEMREKLMEQVYKPMQRTYTQSTQELAEMRKAMNPMLESLNQYRNDFERMGVKPEEAFRTQMAWAAHFARVGAPQGIADMQAAYGMNKQDAGQQDDQYLTPVERSIKADLDAVKKQLGQTSQVQKDWQEQQAQSQNQAYANGVRNELQSFITESKDGKPLHPHVEKVAPAIAGIIRGGLISKTDDYGQPVSIQDQMRQAYDMACRLDPSISTATTNKKQAARAKAAQNSSVVAKSPAGEVDVPELSMAESLEQEYDRLNRSVR